MPGARLSMLCAGRLPVIGLLLCMPTVVWACGSMGLDDPRVRSTLAMAFLVPMIALIPVELWMLARLGKLGGRAVPAYFACLAAKLSGVLLVTWAASNELAEGVVVAELIYSLGHCLASLIILQHMFKLSGRNLWLTAVSISTVIPWLYSLGFWLIIRTIA